MSESTILTTDQVTKVAASAFTVISIIIIADAVYLKYRKASDSAHKNAGLWLVISSFGMILICLSVYFLSALAPLNSYYFPFYVLHTCGYALLFVPVILRSWRVICLFRSTPDCIIGISPCRLQCKMASMQVPVGRGNPWFTIRLFIFLLPLIAIFVTGDQLLKNNTDDYNDYYDTFKTTVDYIRAAYYILILLLLYLSSFIIYSTRDDITITYLDESSSLGIFVLFATAYTALAEIFLWWIVIRSDLRSPWIYYYSLYTIFAMLVMYTTTTGFKCYIAIRDHTSKNRFPARSSDDNPDYNSTPNVLGDSNTSTGIGDIPKNALAGVVIVEDVSKRQTTGQII